MSIVSCASIVCTYNMVQINNNTLFIFYVLEINNK